VFLENDVVARTVRKEAAMSLFSFPDDTLTSYAVQQGGPARGAVKVARSQAGDALALTADHGTTVDLEKQFVIFQLNPQADGPALLESSKVDPKIEGSPDAPDVLVALEMMSFHLGSGEAADPDTRATLRINFGKDESSTDKRFDTAFWSIAAGLNLYNQAKGKQVEGKDLKVDMHKAFGHRPIEIPGGLGRLSLEIVRHAEPPWWRRIFRFLQSDTGETLVSVLGFPAITSQAIRALDELLNRLVDSDPVPLFKSVPMRLALSKYARDEFTGGSARVSIGALSRGFCVMARGQDFPRISQANVTYMSTFGKLVPRDVSEADLLSGKYDDTLAPVTYAVFRVGTKSTKLDPTFNYS
jgi:hypothetical protein